MSGEADKEAARERIVDLVQRFKRNETDHLHATYNETQARTEFITPFLEALGWDVHNIAGHPLAFREVIEEATVEVSDERHSRKPDYELRLARQRKLFVEAKKPSVHLDRDRGPAFQTRRYGYSASLPISIVTNFRQLAIYDCRPIPEATDEPSVARLDLLTCEEFEARFDDLWGLLSREFVYSGAFDREFGVDATRRGAEQFDDYFFRQVYSWRERLALDIHSNAPDLTAEELTYAVQLFLSRIVFLRICEDREIEKYETLKNINVDAAFDGLMTILRRADEFYNSGLFALLDDDRLSIRVGDATLTNIISELYYPQSPFIFAVVETAILGEIYEQFLGEVITIRNGSVEIISKPEVRASGGVVPTPAFIAAKIVERTLGPMISGKSPADLNAFTVADICCGSGTFLVSSYEFLLDHYLNWYISDGTHKHSGRRIYETGTAQWRLTFEEKRRILLTHLRGVDIDPNAVEVAQFSLLLKLIEDESQAALNDYVVSHKNPALPPLAHTIRCGNSLVSAHEWQEAYGMMSTELREKLYPFTWADEFTSEMATDGFHVVVGNPPYIRIQNMVAYSPEEVEYYQQADSPYTTAQENSFDKYALFIERALSLVRPSGRVGMIVPHKFMTIQTGHALRELLTADPILEEIVHFGVKQVFGHGTSNYTCILVMNRAGVERVKLDRAGPLEEWRYGQTGSVTYIPAEELGSDSWEFANEEARKLFARIRDQFREKLSSVAHIEVGVQTSADDVYIFREASANTDTVTRHWKDQDWPIERAILRPCLHDATLYAFAHPVPNAWVIFPYEIVRDSKNRRRARLFQPKEMAKRFPECWAYLCARRKELEKRNIVGGRAAERQWYQYGRSQSLTKFDRPKIVLPVLSLEARYAFDESNTLFTGGGNGPYYMVRVRDEAQVSNLFLLAVLNHPLSEAMVRTNTSPFRGGYYSHGNQFIENLPVPIPEHDRRVEIETITKDLIVANDTLLAARTPRARVLKEREIQYLRENLEAAISEVFELSAADMSTIEAVPIPN